MKTIIVYLCFANSKNIMFKKALYGILKRFKFLPPELYVKIYYEYYTVKRLDLKNPREFNQKIQWLKVYYRKPILTQLVDKYSVRSYVSEKIGDRYLNELIEVYDRPSQIDFKALPHQFVIKAVHGCHFNIIVKDKKAIQRNKVNYLLNKW